MFATVRPDDTYATFVTIPASKAAKRYAITARCGGGNFGITAPPGAVRSPTQSGPLR